MTDVEEPSIGLETRLLRLETIVAALEREELELEDALRLFEEGIGHLRLAREVMDATELRIEKLVEGLIGDDTAQPGRRGE